MADKILDVPPRWAALHRRGQSRLLMAEKAALTEIRSTVRTASAPVLSALSDARTPLAAITVVRAAQGTVQQAFAGAVLKGHAGAREAARTQLGDELGEVNYSTGEREAIEAPRVARTGADEARANAVAASFTAAWSALLLSKLATWSRRDDADPLSAAGLSLAPLDSRIRRIATTEVAHTFNAEIEDGLLLLARRYRGARWLPEVRKRHDGSLDSDMCRICRKRHGTTLPLATPFPAGLVPGDIHPGCRCTIGILVVQRASAHRQAA